MVPSLPTHSMRAPCVPPWTSVTLYQREGEVFAATVEPGIFWATACPVESKAPFQKKICEMVHPAMSGPCHTAYPPEADGLLMSPPVLAVRARVETPFQYMICKWLPSVSTQASVGVPVVGST